MKKFSTILIFATAFVAQLQSATATPYLKIEAGAAFPLKFKNDNRYAGNKPKNGVLYGASLGYQFMPNFRGELELLKINRLNMDFNASAGTALAPTAVKVKQKFKSDVAMVNIYYDIDNFSGLVPFISAGVGVANNKSGDYIVMNDQKQGFLRPGTSKQSVAFNAGVGVSYYIVDRVALDISYKFFYLGKANTTAEKHEVEIAQAPQNGMHRVSQSKAISAVLKAHTINLGIRANF